MTMKKLLVLLYLLCVGNWGNVHAANTDVSNINNVVYITPFNASPGSEISLSIQMKNTAQIRGFQFDLYLPDDITVVKSSKGKIQGELNTGRLPAEDEHQLTFSEQSDGAIRFLCSSQYDECFTGSDGVIATLKVNVDANMAVGDYPIQLKSIILTETDISVYYETALVESTVTITAPSDGRVVLDETSTTAPDEATNVNVRVKRTINANTWSTICLPFAMNAEQVTTAFGSGVELGNFIDYEVTEDANDKIAGLTVNFEEATAIEANHPYIIKVSDNVTEFTVDGVNITPEDDPCVEFDNGKTGTRRQVYGTFMGTYVADFDFFNYSGSKHPLFLNGGKFYYATANTKHMKAFRAYFDFVEWLADLDDNGVAPSRAMISFGNDGTTRITNADFLPIRNGHVYSISGQYLGERQNLGRLPKGVYIIDGKKEVVK